MAELSPPIRARWGRGRLTARVRALDRVDIGLGVVFVLAVCFYVWTAAGTMPLSLHGGSGDRYNLLASALLHLHLSVGRPPAGLLHLANPYNPELNSQFTSGPTDATSINDDILYHGQLYFEWGPAPALVLLVPLHLLGFEPSASVTVAVFGVAGVGFALAALRVIIRQIGAGLPLWVCVLAGLALSLCSVVAFILRSPSISQDTLAGGYCFAMAGIWLAVSAIASRQASLTRLALMSLCIGLAGNSRPTLWLVGLVLIPVVYLSLRSSQRRRSLALALALPVGVCFALFLAYNQARFHSPLEVGARYQLAGYESSTAPLGRLSYVLPGAGFYGLTAPQLGILFPFITINPPHAIPPVGLAQPEATGGILPMAPIVAFVVLLPWLWRRRPALLGPLAAPLLVLVGAGLAIPLLPSYDFFAPTERYEVDFATLLVLGGLAAWLALSAGAPNLWRRGLRVGGGLLLAWGCAAGLAISLAGSGAVLATKHPGTWRTLEDITSPISTAVAAVAGHPVLAEVAAAHEAASAGSHGLESPVSELSLSPLEQAELTIVSPGGGKAALTAQVELAPGSHYGLQVDGPGSRSESYPLPAGGGEVDVPLRLNLGLNRITITPTATSSSGSAAGKPVMLLTDPSVASR